MHAVARRWFHRCLHLVLYSHNVHAWVGSCHHERVSVSFETAVHCCFCCYYSSRHSSSTFVAVHLIRPQTNGRLNQCSRNTLCTHIRAWRPSIECVPGRFVALQVASMPGTVDIVFTSYNKEDSQYAFQNTFLIPDFHSDCKCGSFFLLLEIVLEWLLVFLMWVCCESGDRNFKAVECAGRSNRPYFWPHRRQRTGAHAVRWYHILGARLCRSRNSIKYTFALYSAARDVSTTYIQKFRQRSLFWRTVAWWTMALALQPYATTYGILYSITRNGEYSK